MYNTGNPLGSKDILDLYDNSENIDYFANSQLDEHPDRFGSKRLTLAGLIKRSMALRNEINDFSGALTFKPEWSDVPMNVSEGVGGEGGALNLQAEALGNRSVINKIASREALRRTYQEVGLNLVEGSFEQGGVLVNTNDVLLHEATGKVYSGPVSTVPAGTNPASGFTERSSELIRITYFSGPLRSLSQSQFALSSLMTPATQTARVQGFIDSFISIGGCAVIDQDAIIDDIGVYARSGVDIRFTNESTFTKEPTSAQGYGMLWISGVKNVNIYSPVLIGDKYSHLGDTGEFGMGLRIIGECDNVIIHNPICDEMWGDGIYIGEDSNRKYPSGVGVTICNPVCRKNRRQGISYTGGVVRIENPICQDTKSSDSRFTLSAGPHAGIDIEPNNPNPVIDIEIINPNTARNDGDGILFTPFFIKTSHNLKVKITNHVDNGSKHSFRILGDNDLFSGFVHYDGFGQNNKLCALYIDAWKKCAECDINIYMRAKTWGRDSSSSKFGAAYAWGSSAPTDGDVKISLSCIDTPDKIYLAYHLGPTDLNLKITTDNSNGVALVSSAGSVIDVKVDGPFKKQMSPVNVGYGDFFNSFQVNGDGGNRSLGFDSSWFTNMRDGDIVEVDAKNCAQLLIQTTTSQASQGGAIIRPDGTLGNYKVTPGLQKFINVRFVKYGYFMLICSLSGGIGVNA